MAMFLVNILIIFFYFRTHTIILLDHDDKIEYNEWTMINANWEHQCFTTTLKYET